MEQKQKAAYLKALIYIAAADDTVQDSERAQFTELGKLYGLTTLLPSKLQNRGPYLYPDHQKR